VPLSFALQNMDVAKASERLLKLAVSIHIYLCIHVQIYKRVPGVSEIACKSTIFKALSRSKSMKVFSKVSIFQATSLQIRIIVYKYIVHCIKLLLNIRIILTYLFLS